MPSESSDAPVPTPSASVVVVAEVAAAGRQRARRRELRRSITGLLIALALHLVALWWLYGVLLERGADDPPRIVEASLQREPPQLDPEPPEPPPLPPEPRLTERIDPMIDPIDHTVRSSETGASSGLGGAGLGGGGYTRVPLRRPDPVAGGATDSAFDGFVEGLRERGLDVVFVVDATGSMEVFLARARALVDEIIGDLSTVVPNLRLGLVAYRDHVDTWTTRSVPLTADRYSIHNFLDDLDAGGGGRDLEEAVLEGLRVAIEENPWRRGARHVVILVGDAPMHPEDETATYSLVRQFARSGDQIVNVLYTGTRAGAAPTQRQTEDRERLARLARDGGGVMADLGESGPELRRYVTDATFGPEWAAQIEALLGRTVIDMHARVVARRVEKEDRAWLLTRLLESPEDPAVVEGALALFDAQIAKRMLELTLDETRPRAQRSAALYVLKRGIARELGKELGDTLLLPFAVDEPLTEQRELIARLEREVERLAERRIRSSTPPAPPGGRSEG